jgi:hypothetical protein
MPDAASNVPPSLRSGIDGDEHSGMLKTVMAGRYPYTRKSEFRYRYIGTYMARAMDALMAPTMTRRRPPQMVFAIATRQTMA